MLFDQGLGDIFTIRVAGNCLDVGSRGSLECVGVACERDAVGMHCRPRNARVATLLTFPSHSSWFSFSFFLYSCRYAVAHLGVKVVVIMGHEFCGAVGAAMGDTSVHPPSLKLLLDGIQEGLPLARLSAIMDKKARDREAVLTNVHNQVATLMKDPLVKDKVDAGVLIVIGAFYSLSSGVVDFVTAV